MKAVLLQPYSWLQCSLVLEFFFKLNQGHMYCNLTFVVMQFYCIIFKVYWHA